MSSETMVSCVHGFKFVAVYPASSLWWGWRREDSHTCSHNSTCNYAYTHAHRYAYLYPLRASEDRCYRNLERFGGDIRCPDRPGHRTGGVAGKEYGWHTRWQ